MDVELLKEWHNEGETYKPGEVLEVTPDDAAEQLISDGIAEKYNPKVHNVPKGFNAFMEAMSSDDRKEAAKGLEAIFNGDVFGSLGGFLDGKGNKMRNRGLPTLRSIGKK